MQLNVKTFSQIVTQEAAAVASASPLVSNFSPGSVIRALLESAASVGLWLQAMILQVLTATRLATSVGLDVDSFVADYTLTRLPAIPAVGLATFSRFTSFATALLTPGTQVKSLDGTQIYTVTTDTSNVSWVAAQGGYLAPVGTASVTVPIAAVTAGSGGNVLAGAVGLIASAAPFDTVANSLPLTTGVDAESDAALRSRFANFMNTRFLSTTAALIYTVSAVQQGLSVAVAETVDTVGTYKPGSVVMTVDDGTGAPPAALLAAVGAAANLVRAAGITLAVQGPVVVAANIAMTITVGPGYVKTTLQPLVQAALSAYVSRLAVAAPLPYSMLATLAYGVSPGIINVSGVTLNALAADLVAATNQVIRGGTVTVS